MTIKYSRGPVDARATVTDTTLTTCIAAQDALIRTVLESITLTNSSATAVTVNILDGATVRWTFPVPAGGGVVFQWKHGLRGTKATAWKFQSSASANAIVCCMEGHIEPVPVSQQ